MYPLLDFAIQNVLTNFNAEPPNIAYSNKNQSTIAQLKQSLFEYILHLCHTSSIKNDSTQDIPTSTYDMQEIANACYLELFQQKESLNRLLQHLHDQDIHHEKLTTYFADLQEKQGGNLDVESLRSLVHFNNAVINRAQIERDKPALLKTVQSACTGYLNNLLEKNKAAQTKLNAIKTQETNKKSDINRLPSQKDTPSDAHLIHTLFKEYTAYLCLLGNLPFILEKTLSASQDKRINYNTKESNQALNHFLKGILPESCPPIIAQAARLYINATGISTRILSPELVAHLDNTLNPFIHALSQQHKSFEDAKKAYFNKGIKSKASRTQEHTRQTFLTNSFDIEFEPTTMQPALLPLLDLAHDFGKLQNNVQNAVETEGYINTLREVFEGFKNLDNTVNNPIFAYAIQNMPQAQQLFHYYQAGKSVIHYLSDLFSEGASKTNTLYQFLKGTFVGASTNADREKLFERQFAYFRFYQLAHESMLDPCLKVVLFENYMQSIGLDTADISFKEYEQFVKTVITDKPDIPFEKYNLKECILHFYQSNQPDILSESTQMNLAAPRGIGSNTFNVLYIFDLLQTFQEKLDRDELSEPQSIGYILAALFEIQEACDLIGNAELLQAVLTQSIASARILNIDTTAVLNNIQSRAIEPLMTGLITKLRSFPSTKDHFSAANRKPFFSDKIKEARLRSIIEHRQQQANNVIPVAALEENRAVYSMEIVPAQYASNITNTLRNILTAFQHSYLNPQENRSKAIAALYHQAQLDGKDSNNYNEAANILDLCKKKEQYLLALKDLLTNDHFYQDFEKFLTSNINLLQTIIDPTKSLELPNLSDLPSHLFSVGKLVWEILPQHLAGNYNPHALFIAFTNFLKLDRTSTLLQNLHAHSKAFTTAYDKNDDFTLTQDLHDPCAAHLDQLKEKMIETTIDAILRVRQGLGGAPIHLEKQMVHFIKEGLEQALAPFPIVKIIALEVFKTKEVQEKLLLLLKNAGDCLLDKAKESALQTIGIVTARAKETLAINYLKAPETADAVAMSAFGSFFLQYRSLTSNTSSEAFAKATVSMLFSNYLVSCEHSNERENMIDRIVKQFERINHTYFIDTSENTAPVILSSRQTTLQLACLIKQLKNDVPHQPMLEILMSELLSQLLFGMITTTNSEKKLALETSLLAFTQDILRQFDKKVLPDMLKTSIELITRGILKTPIKELTEELRALQKNIAQFKMVTAPISSENLLEGTFPPSTDEIALEKDNLVVNESNDGFDLLSHQDNQSNASDIQSAHYNHLSDQPVLKQKNISLNHQPGYQPGESYRGWAKRTTPLLQKIMELISLSSTTLTLWVGLLKTASLFGITIINISGISLPIIASALAVAASTVIVQVLSNTFQAVLTRRNALANRVWPLKIAIVLGIFIKSFVYALLNNLFLKSIASKFKSIFAAIADIKNFLKKDKAIFPTLEESVQERAILEDLGQTISDVIKLLEASKEGIELEKVALATQKMTKLLPVCQKLQRENDAREYIGTFKQDLDLLIAKAKAVNASLTFLEKKLNILAPDLQKNDDHSLYAHPEIHSIHSAARNSKNASDIAQAMSPKDYKNFILKEQPIWLEGSVIGLEPLNQEEDDNPIQPKNDCTHALNHSISEGFEKIVGIDSSNQLNNHNRAQSISSMISNHQPKLAHTFGKLSSEDINSSYSFIGSLASKEPSSDKNTTMLSHTAYSPKFFDNMNQSICGNLNSNDKQSQEAFYQGGTGHKIKNPAPES